LLDFHDFRPVVHRADEHYDCYVEQPDEVQDYRDILARLAAVSLDAEQSRTLITEVITTANRPGQERGRDLSTHVTDPSTGVCG
jgi:hypothetical protein